jgi:hypothetical protein
MSKRNFILFIIILGIALVVLFGFFYFTQPTGTGGGDDGGTNFFANLNPFRRDTGPKPPVVTTPEGRGDVSLDGELSETKLKRVSSIPISGYASFKKERYVEIPVTSPAPATTEAVPPPPKAATPPPTEFATALRYVDRATGNIFQTFADKIDERKFSTTLIPAVYEAFFGNKGESVLMRYLKSDNTTIETFFGTLPKELLGGDTTSESSVTGLFLPQNVTDLSLSPDTTKAFYLANVSNDVTDIAIGTVLDISKKAKIQVFDSPFTEWLSQWPNSRMITLTTKPSYATPGYMYSIDPESRTSTKGLTKVIGDVGGLTTLTAPNGKLVLYGDSSLSLAIYNTGTNTATAVSVRTMPEKCVWAATSETIYCAVPVFIPGGQYPDSWYKGEVTFSDQIWEIDVLNGSSILLIDPLQSGAGEDVDGIKLSLDASEDYLFFVNKKNSFLWELDLK